MQVNCSVLNRTPFPVHAHYVGCGKVPSELPDEFLCPLCPGICVSAVSLLKIQMLLKSSASCVRVERHQSLHL